MRLLSRYLLRELAAPFLFAMCALTGMLLLNQISKRLGDLVGKGLSAGVIAEVLVLSLPFIIALTMPMAVLVAVLYGFSHLAADNEITAMRANGVSVAQMLRPVFVAGVILAGVNFLFVDQVLPRSNARLRTLQLDIGRKKPTFALREEAVNPLPPTEYFIQAARIEPGTGRMRDVVIYDLTVPAARRLIYADSGLMAFETNQTDLRLTLHHGTVHEFRPEERGTIRLTAFQENVVRVRDVANALERSDDSRFDRGDREMSTCEMIDEEAIARAQARRAARMRVGFTRQDLRAALRLVVPAPVVIPDPGRQRHCGIWRDVEVFLGRFIFPTPAEAQTPLAVVPGAVQDSAARQSAIQSVTGQIGPLTPQAPEQSGSRVGPVLLSGLSDVADWQNRQRSEIRTANSFAVEIHKKFTISIACLNFVLIGIALALRFPRGGIGLVLGGSLLIFTLFYVCMTGGEQLADRGFVTPAVAMWFPNILIGALGLLGLRAASKNTGTTRGGDLADLGEMLFGWLRRKKAAA